jgi:hypothetical protein
MLYDLPAPARESTLQIMATIDTFFPEDSCSGSHPLCQES